MKYNSIKEWQDEAARRFGPDYLKWKFRCPMCGHVASIQDFKDAGAMSPNVAYQECIGRYTGKGSPKEGDSSGCNWAAYGLFGIPREHDTVVADDGKEIDVYPFVTGTEGGKARMQLLTIKQLREKRGYSAKKAAEAVGTCKQVIYNWENGIAIPQFIYTFNKLLQFYGVKLSRDDQLALEKAFERRIDLRRIKFKVEA